MKSTKMSRAELVDRVRKIQEVTGLCAGYSPESIAEEHGLSIETPMGTFDFSAIRDANYGAYAVMRAHELGVKQGRNEIRRNIKNILSEEV